jgi:hypothetical protein
MDPDQRQAIIDLYHKCDADNIFYTGDYPTLREAHKLTARATNKLMQGWTKGAYARDAENNTIEPNDPAAVCWCLEGAISGPYEAYCIVARVITTALVESTRQPTLCLINYNDDYAQTVDDVIGPVTIAQQVIEYAMEVSQ